MTSIDAVVLIWSDLAQICVCSKFAGCELWCCCVQGARDEVDAEQDNYVN